VRIDLHERERERERERAVTLVVGLKRGYILDNNVESVNDDTGKREGNDLSGSDLQFRCLSAIQIRTAKSEGENE
jgi:hypothetical protein